jgi:hypothetical protein
LVEKIRLVNKNRKLSTSYSSKSLESCRKRELSVS